jgi:hypothetical protein
VEVFDFPALAVPLVVDELPEELPLPSLDSLLPELELDPDNDPLTLLTKTYHIL